MLSNDSSVLITGGTGSFGRAFVKSVLSRFPMIKRLVIFSRDELKQSEFKEELNYGEFPGLRFFLGDIRDKDRLKTALKKIDIVVHAAALKQVVAAEYNPFEFVKTNVLGTQNLIEAALENDVEKFISLSTDKACAPINLYGATKLSAEKLVVAANNIVGENKTIFSLVRYGNVMGSRGSVIPFFIQHKSDGFLPITSTEMTRFNITLKESVELVFWAIENARGGEIFIPKIPSYRLVDLAEAIAPGLPLKVIGVRPGEKIHEEMISTSESMTTVDLGKYFAIMPGFFKQSKLPIQGPIVEAIYSSKAFSYSSNNNEHFLSIDDLKKLLAESN